MKPTSSKAFDDVNFTVRPVWDIQVRIDNEAEWEDFVKMALSYDQCMDIFEEHYPDYKTNGWEVYSYGLGNRACGGAASGFIETEVDIIYSVRIPKETEA